MTAGMIVPPRSSKTNVSPSDTKNNTTKKSRSGFNRVLISTAYGNDDKETPAKSAPTSGENPARLNRLAIPKPQATAKINKSSWLFASSFENRGTIWAPVMYSRAASPTAFARVGSKSSTPTPPFAAAATSTMARVATRSSTRMTPMAI